MGHRPAFPAGEQKKKKKQLRRFLLGPTQYTYAKSDVLAVCWSRLWAGQLPQVVFTKVNFSLIVIFRIIREGAKLELADSTHDIAEGEQNGTGKRYAYLE